MKKISRVFIGVLTLVLVGGGAAEATRGPQGIVYTAHNLSTSQEDPILSMYQSSNEEQVCIFCHTPHGGTLDGPLWNRESPSATSYTHYNSATLSSYLQGLAVNRAVSKESLLCLSCHDGTIAMNSLVNYSHVGVPEYWDSGSEDLIMPAEMFGVPGPRVGTDLSNDHPISFIYASATENRIGTMYNSIEDAEGAGVRFFPPNGADALKRVECSSCHDPHVAYDSYWGALADENYRPFLITSNVGSGLCLACHIK